MTTRMPRGLPQCGERTKDSRMRATRQIQSVGVRARDDRTAAPTKTNVHCRRPPKMPWPASADGQDQALRSQLVTLPTRTEVRTEAWALHKASWALLGQTNHHHTTRVFGRQLNQTADSGGMGAGGQCNGTGLGMNARSQHGLRPSCGGTRRVRSGRRPRSGFRRLERVRQPQNGYQPERGQVWRSQSERGQFLAQALARA